MYLHPQSTLIGQDAQVRGARTFPLGNGIADGDVAARLADEVPPLQPTSDDDAATVGRRFGLLDHAHGVCSRWYRCTVMMRAAWPAPSVCPSGCPAMMEPITLRRTGASTVSSARTA